MSTNTTTIKMGFDTIEINLVGIMFGKVVLSWDFSNKEKS